MAFDRLDRVIAEDESYQLKQERAPAAEEILKEIGWSAAQRSKCNPFRMRIESLVQKAVQAAFAARKLEIGRLLSKDFKHFEQRKYSTYFTPEEVEMIFRAKGVFTGTLRGIFEKIGRKTINSIGERAAAFEKLMTKTENGGKEAALFCQKRKAELSRDWNVDPQVIDQAVFDYNNCNKVGYANCQEMLADTALTEMLAQTLYREFALVEQLVKQFFFNLQVPLTDAQIKRILQPHYDKAARENPTLNTRLWKWKIKKMAAFNFLKELRWPVVQPVHEKFHFYTPIFHLLKNDERINVIPKTLDGCVGFLKAHYPNLWLAVAKDQGKEKNLCQELEKQIGQHQGPARFPLWKVLLESISLSEDVQQTIRMEVGYLALFDEIRKAQDGSNIRLRTTGARIEYLRMHCLSVYEYLQGRGSFTEAEFDAELIKIQQELKKTDPTFSSASDVEKLKRATLYFFSKIHALDKNLTGLFRSFPNHDLERAFNPAQLTDEIKKIRLRFAAKYLLVTDMLGSDYLQHPYLKFVVSPTESQWLQQGEAISQEALKYYRGQLGLVLRSSGQLKGSVDVLLKAGSKQLAENGKIALQLEKDLARLPDTTIIQNSGIVWTTKGSSQYRGTEIPEQREKFLQDLSSLHKRLKNPNQQDLYLLQQMVTRTTQNYVAEVLKDHLESQNLRFTPSQLNPELLSQELSEVDSRHIQLIQKYRYRAIDPFNFDHNGQSEEDVHFFEVVYTLTKEGKESRVELTDWIYRHPGQVPVAAQPDHLMSRLLDYFTASYGS